MALHEYKWTDGFGELKFSAYRWKNKSAGVITYVGDKIKMQNGFVAYTPMRYECDVARDNQTVLAVRVHEGRLR